MGGGGHVLDLFAGSGSTLVAAEQTGRRAFLMEVDALYCDVIVQRWQRFTGQKAKRQPRRRARRSRRSRRAA
jgi:DNA modification methylase